ncbi:MAG: HD domain-containing protein [Bacilli bacterium]|nr:HD domain-containing protein [Bacilli bacterium]
MKFKEMQVGDNNVVFNALVIDCKQKQTVNQTPYYGLTLFDGETSADSRIWNVNIVQELKAGMIESGKVYTFTAKVNEYNSKNQYIVTKVEDIDESVVNVKEFYRYAPVEETVLKAGIKEYISKIDNKVLSSLVKVLIGEHAERFFTYPAAMTMHHNYLSGLAYHTYSMLKLADAFLINYPNLNKNLLYAGILIHDIGKIEEFTEAKSPTYSLKGNLLGHLVIGLTYLEQAGQKLNVTDTEEYLALQHMIAAHHGELEYGSPKEPAIACAVALYLIDLSDSKMAAINDELGKTEKGTTTNPIPTLSKKVLYVPNID